MSAGVAGVEVPGAAFYVQDVQEPELLDDAEAEEAEEPADPFKIVVVEDGSGPAKRGSTVVTLTLSA